MAAAMGSIGTVTVAPLAVAAILLGLSSEGSATATKVALIKETMAALDIVIFSNSYRPYGFLIGIYPIWHHFDDVGLAADGELFISCNECAFLVCWTCYEYERREGSQVCPQMQTRFKHHKGCALAGRSYEDIQYMAEAMLQGHMSYGRGLMSICLKLFTQCLKSLCSPMARWLMIFLRNSTLSSLPSWVGEERGFTHFPLRIAVFQCNPITWFPRRIFGAYGHGSVEGRKGWRIGSRSRKKLHTRNDNDSPFFGTRSMGLLLLFFFTSF